MPQVRIRAPPQASPTANPPVNELVSAVLAVEPSSLVSAPSGQIGELANLASQVLLKTTRFAGLDASTLPDPHTAAGMTTRPGANV
jgi:hypothetical protein